MDHIILRSFFIMHFLVSQSCFIYGQEVPIINYSIDENGQVQLEVSSTTEHYYILKIRHNPTAEFELATSMTMGQRGTTTITEVAGSYPLEYYQVLEYSIHSPFDTDGDSIDDVSEYQHMPEQTPINSAASIERKDGIVSLDDYATYKGLSITDDYIQWSEFLNGKVHVKYIIVDFHAASPKTYFINSNSHDLHQDFAHRIGVDHLGDQVKKGQIIYHPTTISTNGRLGTFAFNYSNGHGQDFEVVQRTYELLAANIHFLKNNLSYFITANNEDEYDQDLSLFENSRVPILFETDVYAAIDYWALNPAEGYGFFRQMTLEEVPGPRDIVLYDALPNALPRVGDIITSVIQTPLSHVNLRAIQDNIPNAFIQTPLANDSVADLLNKYIHFKVTQDKYLIREASLNEVNEWYEDIRPQEEQIPSLNLNYTSILPLDSITFEMSDGYGAKCTNVATMRSFGFPEETIPNGFGVPFYFYQAFMNYNRLFEEAAIMINDGGFQSDRIIRKNMLKDFRNKIRKADLPNWMLDRLNTMHTSFPKGTSVRCRSSTNNEDLPGFSGAGLYTSKTQHPHEGHISKSIRQVYAGLWNLRAFEERAFHRIDHFSTSMGVLCHPNYSNEKANGVGVSTDPIYNTTNTFYLNTQIGEDLVTNPNNASIPEEILLDKVSASENDFIIIQRSNLLASNDIILEEHHLDQMRNYLSVIHNNFEQLYNAQNNTSFAMDIEYKITSDNRLIIKQARPWASYIPHKDPPRLHPSSSNLKLSPNPADDYIDVRCQDCNLTSLGVTNIAGQLIQKITFTNTTDIDIKIPTWHLSPGVYITTAITENNIIYDSKEFIIK